MKKMLLLLVVVLISTTVTFGLTSKDTIKKKVDHPHYLKALSNLRAARWMLEHRPGNWTQTTDEVEAVKKIDAAISEIKKASIDDGKDINDHPKAEEISDHQGRLKKALEWLKIAKKEVDLAEDNAATLGLQQKVLDHISGAIKLVNKAIKA